MNRSVSQLTANNILVAKQGGAKPAIAETIPFPERDNEGSDSAIPQYMHEVYEWAYLDPRNAQWLDRELVVNTILWGNSPALRRALLCEIEPASNVFQAAHVYGRMVSDLAEKIGPEGHLDVIDVVPLQVGRCKRKLARFPQAHVRHGDAARNDDGRQYDVVVCYFLLHEVPEAKKHGVVDALLERVPEGGKAVFIDYSRTVPWHPLGGLMRLVFKTLEPFAMSLRDNEIHSYARRGDDFHWTKQTFFGGLYQKVVAVHR